MMQSVVAVLYVVETFKSHLFIHHKNKKDPVTNDHIWTSVTPLLNWVAIGFEEKKKKSLNVVK